MFFSFSYEPYIAIIGDIKKSKTLIDRKLVQEKLKSILNHINQNYAEDISAKFMITLGDEFQGLLCNGKNVWNIITEIQRRMYPVEIRFGIGIGEIATDINAEMAIGADGPGYYKARSAVEFLKKKELKNKEQASNVRIEMEEDKNSAADMLNTIFSLLTVIQNGWTDRQRETIWEYEKYDDGQKKCAERMGITQSSVQRNLHNGNYYAYRDAVDIINNVLREIRRENV